MRLRPPSRILGGAATAAPRCPIRPNTILALALLLPACQQIEIAKVTEPPVVSIQTPADSAVFDEGVTITMQEDEIPFHPAEA